MRIKFKVGDRVYHRLDRIHFGTVKAIPQTDFYMVNWDAQDDYPAHDQLFVVDDLRKEM